MREYALASQKPEAATLNKAGRAVRTAAVPTSSLNEVGVTDGVMTSLWRHAPRDSCYAISSQAEAGVLGGDLAIVAGEDHIRIYQAKLVAAVVNDTHYILKSPLTSVHGKHLTTDTFHWLSGRQLKIFPIHGYLALYQNEYGFFDHTGQQHRRDWWAQTAASVNAPALGEIYYWDMMNARKGETPRWASPRGIMAAPVPQFSGKKEIHQVPVATSWPWEYYIEEPWPWGRPRSVAPDHAGSSGSGQGDRSQRNSDAPEVEGAPEQFAWEGSVPRWQRGEFTLDLFDQLYGDEPATLTVIFASPQK